MKLLLNRHRLFLYLLSFLEGGAVMACELIGAKLLSPYFGTSLYVWAAALGVTLGGLMSGYFFGGRISAALSDQPTALYWTLAISGSAFSIMPFTSHWIMDITIHLPLQWGALVSLLVFMFPPLFGMGMVSPMIIHFLTRARKEVGMQTGNVYAISTLGGILATFLFGFYLIPEYGVSLPGILGGILLSFFPFCALIFRRKWIAFLFPVLWIWLLFLVNQEYKERFEDSGVLYHSDGLLGQLEVREKDLSTGNRVRALMVNNTMQTVIDLDSLDFSFWPYTRRIQLIAEELVSGGDALVLGMGAGMVVNRLCDQGYSVDAVDIDDRLVTVGRTYFGLDTECARITIGDARHFVRTTAKQYDLIVVDVFRGESAPSHLLTREGIADIAAHLSDHGLILLNFYGYLDGYLGELTQEVAQTIARSGYHIRLLPTEGLPDQRNVVMAISKDPDVIIFVDQVCSRESWLSLKWTDLDTEEEVRGILSDNRPREDLYARPAARWRALYNHQVLLERSVPK